MALKKRGRGDLSQKKEVVNTGTPRCDLCGKEEKTPVALQKRGRILWICYGCYKKGGRNGRIN